MGYLRESFQIFFYDNLESYKLLDPVEVFDKPDARITWIQGLRVVSDAKSVLLLFQSFLCLYAQSTQVLSSKHEVTISLARLSIRSIRRWKSSSRAKWKP